MTYDAYGRARHHWTADITGDGAVGIADQSAMIFAHNASIGNSDYNVDADITRTGTVNDQNLEWTTTQHFQAALPKGQLSAHGNSIGYAGYVFNAEILGGAGLYTVRFRHFDPGLGRDAGSWHGATTIEAMADSDTSRNSSAVATLPKIAIVGRPNVGKSSLLNRLAGRRVSIVDPTPGVTRDRVATVIELDPPLETPRGTPSKTVELIDTGGYGVYTAEGKRYDDVGADLSTLTGDIEGQIATAIEQAQVIMFLLDAQSGITSLDQTIAKLLRESGAADRVLPVANKVDDESWMNDGMEAARLGFGQPVCISASTRFGVRKLLDRLHERVNVEAETQQFVPDADLKLAIVGKRNAGKSTLINTLAGEPRVIVSEIAGTTRDSVDVRFGIEGRSILAIDTAGLRKRKSFADDVEYYAYHRMLQSIRRADVAALLVDATADVSQVDKKLAQELQRQFKPTIIVVNKWDLVDESKTSPEDYLDYLTKELRGLDYAPIVFISAKAAEGMRDLVAMAFNLYRQASHREPTGKLNAIIEDILKQRGPSSKLGTRAKVLYVNQVETNPPTIVMVVNDPKLFEGNYERYMMNRLREELPFSEVPIRLIFSRRKRADLEQMKARGRERDRAVDVDSGLEEA